MLNSEASSARAWGDFIARDPHGIQSLIRVAPRAIKRGALFAADVLLHEMVHQWCCEVVEDDERGYRGHGPQFAKKCNEIGKQLGLADVAARGKRVGLPDCAAWPMNVRPEGYYPPTAGKQKEPEPEPEPEPAEPEPEPGDGVCGHDAELLQLRLQLRQARLALDVYGAELQQLRVQRDAQHDARTALAADVSAMREEADGWRDAAQANEHDAECHRREMSAQRARRAATRAVTRG